MNAKIINKYSIRVINYDYDFNRINKAFCDNVKNEGVEDATINEILSKTKEQRTIKELQLLAVRQKLEDDKNNQIKELEDYLPFVSSQPDDSLDEFDSVVPYYEEIDGSIIQRWEIRKNDSIKISNKIQTLKKSLEDTDFKVIKCYEAALIGDEMPYDTASLISERQSCRVEINNLQELLNS